MLADEIRGVAYETGESKVPPAGVPPVANLPVRTRPMRNEQNELRGAWHMVRGRVAHPLR
jgi:hypothetical protein